MKKDLVEYLFNCRNIQIQKNLFYHLHPATTYKKESEHYWETIKNGSIPEENLRFAFSDKGVLCNVS